MKEESDLEERTDAELADAAAEEADGSPGAEEAASGEDVSGGNGATPGDGKKDGAGELSPIKAFTESEGVEQRPNVSLREILGGDILTAGWLRRQMGLILLCTFFAIIYITNRYSAEQEIIEIERLKTELTEVRYRALTRSGELTVKTRQSQIEKSLRQTSDSVLQSPKEPPFLIKSQSRDWASADRERSKSAERE